jgi:hypothetical protein
MERPAADGADGAARHHALRGRALQASGIIYFQAFELVFAVVLVAGAFVMSGSRIAVVAMLA